MSWFLLNRNLTLLEPYDWKLSCTVLRGERGSNAPDLPGSSVVQVWRIAVWQNHRLFVNTAITALTKFYKNVTARGHGPNGHAIRAVLHGRLARIAMWRRPFCRPVWGVCPTCWQSAACAAGADGARFWPIVLQTEGRPNVPGQRSVMAGQAQTSGSGAPGPRLNRHPYI